jgi:non-specific serine/threonine protein kinase
MDLESENRLHNLPLQLTIFVGRQGELAEVKLLVETNRLVTITGPGGAGKTRLALKVGESSLASFKDGVFLVEFAALTDPALLPQAVLTALKLTPPHNQSEVDNLIEFLQAKNLLLLLDNCEHLIQDCARLANSLLLTCPRLHLLATSREALNIDGETLWRIPTLSLPPASPVATVSSRGVALDLAELNQSEAVQLFVERAKNARPGFQLSQENGEIVSQLCRRLDGIPLGIELAAATLKALDLSQLVLRLDQSFRLLTGGSRLALKRQQTLEATIEWSYQLLEEPEQVLFRRLSIFAGGFTIENAEFVCSDDTFLPSSEILTHLTQLIYKSMIQPQDGRYRLLEMLRQFGHMRLIALGELTTVQKQYAGWCLQLAQEAGVELDGAHQKIWSNRLIAEQDNLRAVLGWCFASEDETDRETGVGICVALGKFWRGKAFGEEGRRWLEKAVELTKNEAYRASLLSSLGYLAIFSGEPVKALELHQESIMLWRKLTDKSGLAEALTSFGSSLVLQGETEEAETILQEAISLNRQLNNKAGLAYSLCSLGMNYHSQDRIPLEPQPFSPEPDYNLALTYRLSENQDQARELLEEALQISRQTEDETTISYVLQILGEVARAQGDYSRAKSCYEESLNYRRESGNQVRLAASLLNLGYVANFFEEYEQANHYFREGLAICKNQRLFRAAPAFFSGVAEIARVCGQAERGVRLLAATQAAHHHLGATPDLSDMLEYYRTLQRLKPELSSDEFAKLWAEGQGMTIDQAIDYSLEEIELKPVKVDKPEALVKALATYPAGLSLREVEVLRRVAAGLTNAEIAEALVISPRTVDAHLTSIYGKIGVKSRSAATRFALEHHLT